MKSLDKKSMSEKNCSMNRLSTCDRPYITIRDILHGEIMVEVNIPEKPDGAEELEKQGVEGLVHSLHDSTDPMVRQYAAYLLGKAHNPRAIQPQIGRAHV